jgi:SPP1 family predicted phage head-tail adaptor
MDDVLSLISYVYEKNAYGVSVPVESSKEILCKVNSITRVEFFQAGRTGLNPSFMFTVFAGDYAGETVIEYAGQRYAVYRTYKIPGEDYMELYVQREGGTNGQGQG